MCHKKRARDEAPGMSGVWDWSLKETPRATSAARWNRWGAACGIGPRAPKVCARLGAFGKFIFSRIKKRRKPKVKIVTLQLCEVKKSDISSMKKSPHVPLRQIAEGKRRVKELGVV